METRLYSVPVQNGSGVSWERKSANEMTPIELLNKFSTLLLEFHTGYDGDPYEMRDILEELENELLSRCR